MCVGWWFFFALVVTRLQLSIRPPPPSPFPPLTSVVISYFRVFKMGPCFVLCVVLFVVTQMLAYLFVVGVPDCPTMVGFVGHNVPRATNQLGKVSCSIHFV